MRFVRNTARAVERFTKLTNFPVTFNESNTVARWKVHGFAVAHFNRAGYPSLHKLLLLGEDARSLQGRYPEFLLVGSDASKQLVLVAQHMDVSQSLYDKAAMHFPMTVEWAAFEMGRSSVTTEYTAREESTGDLMVRTLYKSVYMDVVTRKACPLSEPFVRKMNEFLLEKDHEKFPALPLLHIPAKHHACEIQVTYSDLDQLFHTNHSNYLKFSMDCASEAAEAGLFQKFDDDLCFYPGKTVSIIHTGQSFVGDRLKVYVWQDQDNVHLLKSVIKKEDADIFHATVAMFP